MEQCELVNAPCGGVKTLVLAGGTGGAGGARRAAEERVLPEVGTVEEAGTKPRSRTRVLTGCWMLEGN